MIDRESMYNSKGVVVKIKMKESFRVYIELACTQTGFSECKGAKYFDSMLRR